MPKSCDRRKENVWNFVNVAVGHQLPCQPPDEGCLSAFLRLVGHMKTVMFWMVQRKVTPDLVRCGT